MSITSKQKECHQANLILNKSNLNFQNFGNVSVRLDSEKFIIKPSGVNLQKTKYFDYPVFSITKNKKILGKLRESSDTQTHAILYKKYPNINSVIHAHSKYSVIWAQSKKSIPILGTTHADYWGESIMVTNSLIISEIKKDYEKNIGKSIISKIKKRDPLKYPGILVANHGPFCWGENSFEAIKNIERLEFIAELAYKTIILKKTPLIHKELINKHYERKNGKASYYGQKINH